MAEDKKDPPFIFEMPIDRLLNADEIIPLIIYGYNLSLVTCSYCGVQGWSADYRDLCSVSCFAIKSGIEEGNLDLIRQSVLLENAAFKDDIVNYGKEKLKVIATDCTLERIRRSYHLKFNYVLKWRGQIVKVNNSEMPLWRFDEEAEVAEDKRKKPKKPRGF
jgi:hypothetical protein